jgi:hypothetical protein
MSSYLSGLLTTTTSRYASLRSLLPTSLAENDGDTPDDTHLCRVLRAYYVEKGRAFPGWLPPDPRAPQIQMPAYSQPNPNIGAGYGGLNNAAGGGSKLGSLWDSQPAQQQQAPGAGPQSLRQQGRGVSSNSLRGGIPAREQYRPQQSLPSEQVQARPLPSQRAGTYQTANATPPGSSSGAGTAQDRLKARLWGGNRSGNSTPVGNQPAPAPAPSSSAGYAQNQRGGGGAYERGNSYNSTSSANAYEDSFRPGVRTGGAGGDRGYGGGGGGGGGGSDKPFVAATSPWASSESEFSGGGYADGYDGGGGGGGGRAPARQGLPSGPAAGRRGLGGGLPTGPRSMR